MSTANIFEQATQLHLRFNFHGLLTTEDIWDLSQNDLDLLYKQVKKQVTDSIEGLLSTPTKEDYKNSLRLEIVRHIFTVKEAARQAAADAAKRRLEKEKIKEIIANKQDESLMSKSLEDLQKMLEE